MARKHWRGTVAAAAVLSSVAACGGGDPAPTPTPTTSATATPSPTPSASGVASTTRLSCPADLVPVTITDRYHYPRPPGKAREALVQQLRWHGYAEGRETWSGAEDFERVRKSSRVVTYLARRADGSVAVELRIEQQTEPTGWAATERRSCEPPRTPPSAEQAAMEPGPDPQVTCDPGYRAMNVIAGRQAAPGSPSPLEALRAFLADNRGALSGTEILTEDQFVPLPDDPDRPREARFAARRADGSWTFIVEVYRGRDSLWRDNGVTACVRADL